MANLEALGQPPERSAALPAALGLAREAAFQSSLATLGVFGSLAWQPPPPAAAAPAALPGTAGALAGISGSLHAELHGFLRGLDARLDAREAALASALDRAAATSIDGLGDLSRRVDEMLAEESRRAAAEREAAAGKLRESVKEMRQKGLADQELAREEALRDWSQRLQDASDALERKLLGRLEASERRAEEQRSAERARQQAWREGVAQRVAAVEQRLEGARGLSGPLAEQVTRLIPDVERLQESCDKVLADRSAFDSWQQRLAACEGAARRAHSADQRLDELRRLVEQTAGEHGRRLNECLGEVGHCRGRISAVEDSVKRLDKSLRIAEQRQLGWDQCRKRDQRDLDLLLDGLQRRLEDAEAQNQHGLQGLLRHLQQPAAALCGRLRGGPSRAGAPAGGLSVRAAATASGVIAPARAPRGPAAGSPAARRGGRAAVVVEQSSFGESSRSLLLAPRGARAAGAVEQGSPGESSRSFLLAPRGERAASPAAARGADAGEQARRRLIGRLFDALDRDGNGLLDQREMEWFARQAGFEGSSEEWAREFRLLCAGTVPAGLKLERFRAMVDEQTVDAGGRLFRGRWFCSHEEICRLLSEPAPAQHSPSRGEGPLLRHGEGGVEPPLLHEANGPRSVGGLDADAQSADAAGRILVQMPRTPQQASARTLLQTPGTTPRAERPGPASGASPARSSFFSEAPRRGCPGAAGLLAGLAAADQASGGQPSESEEEDGHGPPESQGPRASGGDVTVTQPGFSFGAPPGAAAGAWRGAGPEEGAREAGALPRSGPGEELAAHAGRGGEGEGAGGEGSAGSERRLEETGSMGSGAWDDPDSQGDDLSPIAPLSLQVQPPMDEEEEQADSEIAPAAPARWPTDLPRESDSEGEEEQADSEIAPAAPARWPTDLPRESDSEGEDEEPGVLVESIRAPVPRALGRPAAAGPAGGIPAGAARERAALPQGIVRVAPPPLVARPSEEEEEEEEAKEAAPGLAAEAGAEEAVVASPPGSGSSSGHSLDIGVLDDDIEL